MECTLATLLACFSWSNLYLDGGLSYRDIDEYVHTQTFQESLTVVEGVADQQLFASQAKERISTNPYGRIALGHQARFTLDRGVFELSGECFHESSLATGRDRGINGCGIRGRWFPFR